MTRIVSLVLLVGLMNQGAQDEEFRSGEVCVKTAAGDVVIPYRLLKPALITPGERYPLVVFLHGAGERGEDNERQLTYLPRTLATKENRERHPCFLLAPQCPTGRRWAEVDWSAEKPTPLGPLSPALEGVLQALADVLAHEPVDRDRIYLTGLSMGGYGTWDLAVRHPEWFAAVAPICGGGDDARADRLVGVPLWAFHGADDTVVPVDRTRRMIAAIRAAGGRPRYDELEGVAHAAWQPAYTGDDLLPWIFTQRRPDGHRGSPGLATLAATSAAWRDGERIAFLGDSITEAGARPDGYVRLIEEALKGAPGERDVSVIPAGISGHRVPHLLARLDRDVLENKPTVVFIYIGINDVWHSLSGRGTPADEFEKGLRTLIARIREAGADVILATPTTIGERTDGTNELDPLLEEYASISRRVAAATSTPLCDLRRAMIDDLAVMNAAGLERGVLTGDGVHLNAAGNRFLAHHASLALAELFASRKPR